MRGKSFSPRKAQKMKFWKEDIDTGHTIFKSLSIQLLTFFIPENLRGHKNVCDDWGSDLWSNLKSFQGFESMKIFFPSIFFLSKRSFRFSSVSTYCEVFYVNSWVELKLASVDNESKLCSLLLFMDLMKGFFHVWCMLRKVNKVGSGWWSRYGLATTV